jgi:predicted flap endonuclease-1-like 5' DNA nuclease
MALLQKLKEALGFGSGSSAQESEDPTVTVEKAHEAIDPAADEADGEAVPEPSGGDASAAIASSGSAAEPVEDAETDTVAADEETEVEADDDLAPTGKADTDPAGSDESPAGDPVEQITGIGPAYGERLAAMGIETVDELADADPAAVADETSVGEKRATTWIDRANDF